MDFLYKIQVLAIAFVLGVTIWMIMNMIIFNVPPTFAGLSAITISWIIMVKFNPVWHDLWEKFKGGRN